MGWADRLRAAYGDERVDTATQPATVDVAAEQWREAVERARDELGCSFFDFLSAVDEGEDGFRLVCHLVARRPGGVDHLVVRCLLPRERPVAASVAGVFAGARWHERETHEMFGVDFTEGDRVLDLERLLLPAELVGHPLRKDFVLAARAARTWPGAKEPGESDSTPVPTRSRRPPRPPGVPDPAEWGPRG